MRDSTKEENFSETQLQEIFKEWRKLEDPVALLTVETYRIAVGFIPYTGNVTGNKEQTLIFGLKKRGLMSYCQILH
ncbi:MAG: hypothetical protein MRQ07_03570 [Candidatus Midichloria sp.]|nr:hypothetical protein [Candidatus Midichloria sp.]